MTEPAANSPQKVRGRPFEKGKSGNPAGKPPGTRNRATRAVEELLDGESEALTRKAIEMALAGDGPALRLCMDRLIPPRKDRAVTFAMPKLTCAADAAKAAGALLDAVSAGDITPSEAGELGKLVEGYVRALEASEFEERLSRLEQKGK
ncbi:DUF5681 domain-containing protein [Ancylobacter oerskovii]|uniref:DUF5681 domain-containing protein n=1 Tax=Ancylobacter oerskovii TaxID=459519 RepID=A0ABW4YVT2_9HYPH|nr:hypothetical protein [Ancylobacter oerskovii]